MSQYKNELEDYLYNHNYISNNKKSNYQQELSIERAECIIYKHDDIVKKENAELFAENMKLKDKLEQQRKEYQETYKDVREEIKELKQKNNILTEFEKWLETCLENEKYCYLSPHGEDRYRYDIFKKCLDKLQELKEGSNEKI